ncbi:MULTISPECIES: hypothetical protein [unclassified Cupriavidus]|nr:MULTISPECIES: hypothetical protein [unclassified Cupriavidus]
MPIIVGPVPAILLVVSAQRRLCLVHTLTGFGGCYCHGIRRVA